MEDKIEVKEYVRTINNGIKKIDKIFENCTVNKYGYETGESDWDGKYYGIIRTTDIVKHSKNIIDLIELKDFIVIKEEIVVYLDSETLLEKVKRELYSNHWQLESIVTKEQFKSMKYEV